MRTRATKSHTSSVYDVVGVWPVQRDLPGNPDPDLHCARQPGRPDPNPRLRRRLPKYVFLVVGILFGPFGQEVLGSDLIRTAGVECIPLWSLLGPFRVRSFALLLH